MSEIFSIDMKGIAGSLVTLLYILSVLCGELGNFTVRVKVSTRN
ncbi:hypothetical protein ACP4OV_012493 [Aristida adscensionis]